ncbi:MAG TPA: hypothetical protein VK464_08690, partial [Symbiobacteriaceae bacterium]|nr:hypothetical protein [Symbiobacteriaceae bacterium]
MKARRKLSIRTWLVGGIIVLVVASYASVAGLVGFTLLFEPPQPKDQPRDTAAMEQVYQQVESASDRWRDSAWQQAIAPQLDALQLRIQITDLAKQPVFMYPPGKDLLQINRGVFYSTVSSFGSRLRQAAVYQGAQLAGEITWYQRYEEADPSHAAFDRWQNSFMNISWPLAVVGVV